jgi:hypothetical protein
MKMPDGSVSSEAQFDGKDYAADKDIHSTVSLKLVDEYAIEKTDKQNGKVIAVSRMVVSKDGKSMSVEPSDKQRGGTAIYTAPKSRRVSGARSSAERISFLTQQPTISVASP